MAPAAQVIRAVAIAVVLVLCGCAGTRRGAEKAAEDYEPKFPYRFEGNVAVKKSDLIEAAKIELGSFETHGHKAADLDDAAYAMRRELRREGYAHSKVTVRPEPTPESISSVTFVIEEGPKASWGTLTFPGATVHDETHLRKFFVFDTKKKGLLAPEEKEPNPFRATDLDAGIAHVEGLYLGEGYYRVKVGPPKIAWSEDRAVADVSIPVVENRRYVVRDVEIVMEGGAARAEGFPQAEAFEGGPYHPRVAARVVAAVRAALSSEGRILAKIVPSVSIDDASASAAVKAVVTPGPRVMIAGTEVRGNDRTRENFVLERSRLHAGEVLTGERLDRAVDELYGTGLFKSVRVEPVVPKGTESRPSEESYDAQVAIAVEELLARTIDFEVGWGSYELLRGSVRYRDRNLFGTGRDFEVEPAASVKSVGADVRFFDRYIFGKRNTLEILSGVLAREEPSYDLFEFRTEVAVRRRFSERVMGRAGWRFVKSNASDVQIDDDEDERETSTTSGPFGMLQYDCRDNPILPQRGFYVEGGTALSSSAFGGDLDFVDLYAEGSVYFRLAEDLVLGLSARGQTRPVFGGTDALPIQERLFLGGSNTVRSFYEDELGPSDGDGDPIGGLTSLDATVELRQRLWGDLHGAVFYDIGSVGDRSFDLDGFGHAIGFGLRYYLPMGPVRLDVGFNPGPRFASDSDVAVHFSFGFSF